VTHEALVRRKVEAAGGDVGGCSEAAQRRCFPDAFARPPGWNGPARSSACRQKPGCTEFTRILSGAYWIAAAFEKIRTAPFRGMIGGVGM